MRFVMLAPSKSFIFRERMLLFRIPRCRGGRGVPLEASSQANAVRDDRVTAITLKVGGRRANCRPHSFGEGRS
jgi:hypothetical protein